LLQDLLEHVLQCVGDLLHLATERWRAIHRCGCMLGFMAAVFAAMPLVGALGGKPFPPEAWWVTVGLIAVGVIGAACFFWLGSGSAK
jgi:hypothetical protein